MFNKRDKVKKEYLKYKDGKILSFEDENLEKPIKPSIDIDELKEKTNEKVKTMGPIKLIKIIGGILLAIFTIYVCITVYKDIKNGEVGLNKGEKTEETGIFSKNEDLEKIDVNEPIITDEKQDKKKKSTVLTTFNETNDSLYQLTVNDFARLNDYEERTLNRVSLSNELKSNLNNKQKLREQLINSETLYKGVTAELLYETLLSRVDNSIGLSNGLIEQLDLNVKTKDMDSVIEIYNDKEIILKDNEIILLKKYLDSEKIKYTIDEETNRIKYDY